MPEYEISIPIHYDLGLRVEAGSPEEAVKYAYDNWFNKIRNLDEQLEDSVQYAYHHDMIKATEV